MITSKFIMDDVYKSESDFIASVDYLRPPVKRVSTDNVFSFKYKDKARNVQVYPKIRNKVARTKEKENVEREHLRTVKGGVKHYTNLLLKKKPIIEIFKQYSISSCTTLRSSNCSFLSAGRKGNDNKRHDYKTKPLIRVTVIPESEQKQATKLFKKQRHRLKTIQSTSSNQEKSIHTKNLYLVVAGRRSKIYEVKTTGSAILSSDQAGSYNKKDEISLEGLMNIKHLIQSLNMDQKKGKKDVEPEEDSYEKGVDQYESEGYRHRSPIRSEKKQSNRNRVRIYGQLGLTEDDRYVLRYGATVNEKPVTDFDHLTYDILPALTPPEGYGPQCNDTPEVTRDVSAQVSCENNRNECPAIIRCLYSKESQGTQVNFNFQTPLRNECLPVSTFDKNIQCGCNNIVVNRMAEMICKENGTSESHNPLVIISVFPKCGAEEIVKSKCTPNNKRLPSPTAQAQCTTNPRGERGTEKKMAELKKNDGKEKKNIPVNKFNKRISNSRSPSPPIKMTSKSKMQEKQTELKVHKTQVDTSPDRFKAIRDIKNKILEKERSQTDLDPSTSKFNGTISNKTKSRAVPKFDVPSSKQVSKNNNPSRKPSPKRSLEKGTNTEHVKAKKALVDSYTKQLCGPWNFKDVTPPILQNSKVAINIEGEKEYYNVSFDQTKLSTNLKIKKTIKDMASQREKCESKGKNVSSQKNWAHISPSLENLLCLPEKEQESQPVTKTLYSKQLYDPPATKRVSGYSGITIRDSLEISHRREDKHFCDTKDLQKCTSHCNNDIVRNTDLLTPSKHYTGDDCSICDPVVRDKQIRELLGLNKTKCISKKRPLEYSSGNYQYPLQYVYRRKCDANYVAEPKDIIHNKQTLDKENLIMQGRAIICLQSLLSKDITKETSRHRPIILSRKQYNTLKNSIQHTVNCNTVSPEKTQNKVKVLNFYQAIQTKPTYGNSRIIIQKHRKVIKVRQLEKAHRARTTRGRSLHKNDGISTFDHDRRNYLLGQQMTKCITPGRHKPNEKPVKKECKGYRDCEVNNPHLQESKKECHGNNAQYHAASEAHKDKIGLSYSAKVYDTRNDVLSKGHEECHIGNTYQRTTEENHELNEVHRTSSEQFYKVAVVNTRHSDQNYTANDEHADEVTKRTKPHSEFNKPQKDDQLLDGHKNPVGEHLRHNSIYEKDAVQNRICAKRPKNTKNPVLHGAEKAHDFLNLNTENIDNLPSTTYHKRNKKHDNDICSVNENCTTHIERYRRRENDEPINTVLLSGGNVNRNVELNLTDKLSKEIRSPLEIQYTSMDYMKHVNNVPSISTPVRIHSTQTLFRGKRRNKLCTPNLGTSDCSLFADNGFNSDKFMAARDLKSKKPFLKRLMTCFIMQSSGASNNQVPAKVHHSGSTVDSYHISSLGAVEMSSSIYDTSASFYSNHTYLQATKTKRGFLNSVIGFISNRKS